MRQPLNCEQRNAAFIGVGGGVVHPVFINTCDKYVYSKCIFCENVLGRKW